VAEPCPTAPTSASAEYVSLLSHVLMTPLSGIVLWCERLLAKGELSELGERGLVAIDRSARAQSAMLDNLVELSRIQAGVPDLHRSPVDVDACVRDVVVRVSSAARQHGVTIRYERPPEPLAVAGDPVRLRTALVNVVDNAVKASPAGAAVEIAVGVAQGKITIAVSDEGDGIAADAWPALLAVRELSERDVSRRRGGLGLGLPVTRHIVELNGGALSLTTRAPRGARVTMTLPGA
jgi:signal transduction histidine kinase